jgi:dTMP kinase
MLNKRFYSFEGIDYSGKSTQIALLRRFLESRGQKVYVLREPGGTDISEHIRSLLLDKKNSNMTDLCEIFLYSAARTQLVSEKIIPLLEQGYYVIADRYVDSTTAYQGFGRGIDAEMVQQINRAATRGLMPVLTFFLKLDPEESYKRREASGRATDRLEEAGKAFYRRVHAGYLELAQTHPERFIALQADDSVEAIHQRIIQIIQEKGA